MPVGEELGCTVDGVGSSSIVADNSFRRLAIVAGHSSHSLAAAPATGQVTEGSEVWRLDTRCRRCVCTLLVRLLRRGTRITGAQDNTCFIVSVQAASCLRLTTNKDFALGVKWGKMAYRKTEKFFCYEQIAGSYSPI